MVGRNPQEAAEKCHHRRWLTVVLLQRGLEAEIEATWHSRLYDAVGVHEEEHGMTLIRGRRVAVRVRLIVARGPEFPRELPSVALQSLVEQAGDARGRVGWSENHALFGDLGEVLA